jgi:energy-converting hydrogenase Eha subunit C
MELNKIPELQEIMISGIIFSEKELQIIVSFALMIIGNHLVCASKYYEVVAEILYTKGLIKKEN